MLGQKVLELVDYELELTDFLGYYFSKKLSMLGRLGRNGTTGPWDSREGRIGRVALCEP